MSRALTLGIGISLVAATMAGATVWLVATDPVLVAEAIDGGDVSPLVIALAAALYEAFVALLGFL